MTCVRNLFANFMQMLLNTRICAILDKQIHKKLGNAENICSFFYLYEV